MKKLFIAASLLVASLSVNAQEYKPVAGNVTTEIGLTGGLLSSSTNLSTSGIPGVNQLKFRYFLADQLALRVGLNLSKNSTTDKAYDPTTKAEGSTKSSTSRTLLNLGIEKHFAGTDRLSTYVGADLTVNFAGAKGKDENYSGGYSLGYNVKYKNTNANGDVASTGFGLRAVIGADYYFVEKVYLGAEFGWGFLASKNKDTKVDVTPGTGASTISTTTKSSGGSFGLAPAVIANVKIGFRF